MLTSTMEFIGRQQEITFLTQWLADEGAPLIVYIYDELKEKEKKGGIGKTWLLHRFYKLVEQQHKNINSLSVLAEAIDQEDFLTCQIVEEAAEVLGVGIANIINFLNPHRVILGGDVVDEVDLFFDRAVESAKNRTLHASLRNVSIVRGGLGSTAGAYGAAVFAKEYLLQKREEQSTEA